MNYFWLITEKKDHLAFPNGEKHCLKRGILYTGELELMCYLLLKTITNGASSVQENLKNTSWMEHYGVKALMRLKTGLSRELTTMKMTKYYRWRKHQLLKEETLDQYNLASLE